MAPFSCFELLAEFESKSLKLGIHLHDELRDSVVEFLHEYVGTLDGGHEEVMLQHAGVK